MAEHWIAFIVLCASVVCSEPRTYAKEAHGGYEICTRHARGWAMQMKALTDQEYAFGCRKMEYQPREIKP